MLTSYNYYQLLLSPMTFFAYSDPGSGMLIWQLLTAGAFGLLFYARTILKKLRVLPGSNEQESSRTDQSNTTE